MILFGKFFTKDFYFFSNHKKIFKLVAILLSTLTLFNTTTYLVGASDYWEEEKDIRKRTREADTFGTYKYDSIRNLNYEYEQEYFYEKEISKVLNKKEFSSIEQLTLQSIEEKMKTYNIKEFSIVYCHYLLQIELLTIYTLDSPQETINAIIRYNYNLCKNGIPTESKKFITDMFYVFLVIKNLNLSKQSLDNISIGLYCKLFDLFPYYNKNLLLPSIKECLNKLIEEESKHF